MSEYMQRFDSYGVSPVVALDGDDRPTRDETRIVRYAECAEDDADRYAWLVYGRFPNGETEEIGDCHTREAAALVLAGLMEGLKKPGMTDAVLLARNALRLRMPAVTLDEVVRNAVTVERAVRAIDCAAAGAITSLNHVLIPVDKAVVRRILPAANEEQCLLVMEAFRERLRDDLLAEHLPQIAGDVCGAGMRA